MDTTISFFIIVSLFVIWALVLAGWLVSRKGESKETQIERIMKMVEKMDEKTQEEFEKFLDELLEKEKRERDGKDE